MSTAEFLTRYENDEFTETLELDEWIGEYRLLTRLRDKAETIRSNVYVLKQQYDPAIAEGERAIALDPNNARSYAWLAETLSRVGRSEKAVRMVEQALRHKPLIADSYLSSVGATYYLAGQPEEAIAPLKRYIAR